MSLPGVRVPAAGGTVNINLSHLSLDSDILVSFDVLTDASTIIFELIVKIVVVDVRLESNTMNGTSSVLEILDKVEQSI